MLAGYSLTMRQKAYFPDSYSVQSHLSPAAYQGPQLHSPLSKYTLICAPSPKIRLTYPKSYRRSHTPCSQDKINGLRDLQVMLI